MKFDLIKQNSFLVLGRAGLDLYTQPGENLNEAEVLTAAMGGSAGNVAVGLAKLGSKAAVLTKLSNDMIGDFVLSSLTDYGVSTDCVSISDERDLRTSLALVETLSHGSRNAIYRNGAVDFSLTADDIAHIDFGQFGAMTIAGTALASEPSRSAVFASIRSANMESIPVILDVDYRPYTWESPEKAAEVYQSVARQCSIVIGNDEEFDVVAGSPGKGQTFAEELYALGPSLVVYKMGAEGAVTYCADKVLETGIFPANPIKPTGAGDAFLAAFANQLAENGDVVMAVTRGSAAAAIVVSNMGCAPASPNRVELDQKVSLEYAQFHRRFVV